MANQDGRRPSEKQTLSLVLSIFKGENFVVKGSPCKAFLKARCCDLQANLALMSGTVKITPSNSEPEFNSQLAWSLSKKQLKDLRSNRSTIRVSCIVKEDKTGKETEMGYVVLHVKDATTFSAGVDVDPTKATIFPLLGTKDSWKYLQPKLQMVLHLEDGICRDNQDHDTNQGGVEESANKPRSPMPIINAAKLAETKLLQQAMDANRFNWIVNDRDGYFQLGPSSEEDDLYVINTTVISATNLHRLWDGKSPRKNMNDPYYWQVKYTAYGCEIASEPFLLDKEKENTNRLTFIGDKATARIRTNGALFFQYLEETSLEFHIVRYLQTPQRELTNGEIMGFCFASLAELTEPDEKELRLTLEIVTEWGTPRVATLSDKPEIRVLFTLQTEPNYFGRLAEVNNNIVEEIPTQRSSVPVDDVGDALDGDAAGKEHTRRNFAQKLHSPRSPEIDVEALGNHSNVRRLIQFDHDGQVPSNYDEPSTETSSSKKLKFEEHRLSNATSCGFSDSEDCESLSPQETLAKLAPEPGNYHVSIELTRFWLKSKKLIEDEFLLSYTHAPIGIAKDPIESLAQPMNLEFVDVRQGFMILEGEYTKTLKIKSLSESLLNHPLTVEFRRTSHGERSNAFATAMIPFGRIFSEKVDGHVWTLENACDILKNSTNVKIGTLFFKVQLSREADSPLPNDRKSSKPKESSFFPIKTEKHDTKHTEFIGKYGRDPDKANRITEDMREWRKTQEEMYKRQKGDKDQEAAYLKLLSDEAAKRDAEREEVMAKRLAELDKKEKELNKQRRHLEEKEERIKLLELEVKDKQRQILSEKESLHHLVQRDQKRIEEDHKVEVEGMKRRMQGYLDEIEKLKRKVGHLEQKLETKDAQIDSLMASKRELPDSQLQERVALLEQENKTLKSHLREANTKREQYKKQSLALCQKLQRVQEERDQELKDQNENLRLHILASKEHKELKKERKAVQDLSHTLKALQKETIQPRKPDGKGDQPDVPGLYNCQLNQKPCKESEIKRLSEERAKLLQTGAYTPYDLVIKEMENKMVALAKSPE